MRPLRDLVHEIDCRHADGSKHPSAGAGWVPWGAFDAEIDAHLALAKRIGHSLQSELALLDPPLRSRQEHSPYAPPIQ